MKISPSPIPFHKKKVVKYLEGRLVLNRSRAYGIRFRIYGASCNACCVLFLFYGTTGGKFFGELLRGIGFRLQSEVAYDFVRNS